VFERLLVLKSWKWRRF